MLSADYTAQKANCSANVDKTGPEKSKLKSLYPDFSSGGLQQQNCTSVKKQNVPILRECKVFQH